MSTLHAIHLCNEAKHRLLEQEKTLATVLRLQERTASVVASSAEGAVPPRVVESIVRRREGAQAAVDEATNELHRCELLLTRALEAEIALPRATLALVKFHKGVEKQAPNVVDVLKTPLDELEVLLRRR